MADETDGTSTLHRMPLDQGAVSWIFADPWLLSKDYRRAHAQAQDIPSLTAAQGGPSSDGGSALPDWRQVEQHRTANEQELTGSTPPSDNVDYLDLWWPELPRDHGSVDWRAEQVDHERLVKAWLISATAAFQYATSRLSETDGPGDGTLAVVPQIVCPKRALRIFPQRAETVGVWHQDWLKDLRDNVVVPEGDQSSDVDSEAALRSVQDENTQATIGLKMAALAYCRHPGVNCALQTFNSGIDFGAVRDFYDTHVSGAQTIIEGTAAQVRQCLPTFARTAAQDEYDKDKVHPHYRLDMILHPDECSSDGSATFSEDAVIKLREDLENLDRIRRKEVDESSKDDRWATVSVGAATNSEVVKMLLRQFVPASEEPTGDQ